MKYGLLAGLVFTTASHASIDLKANEQPLPVTVDQQAV
ncbi:TPA: ABC transporter substrate-binding protein, partial [Enterobacter hormaechei]|nr:ABC transporter substrate-binding protein [Enterobacter hormaechei]